MTEPAVLMTCRPDECRLCREAISSKGSSTCALLYFRELGVAWSCFLNGHVDVTP